MNWAFDRAYIYGARPMFAPHPMWGGRPDFVPQLHLPYGGFNFGFMTCGRPGFNPRFMGANPALMNSIMR